MGRSKPTFRNYLDRFEGDWQPYRRTLRRRDQAHFDRLFEKARDHADAAGQLDPTDPRLAILFSMLVAHERELQALGERVDGLQQRQDRDAGAGERVEGAGSEADGREGAARERRPGDGRG